MDMLCQKPKKYKGQQRDFDLTSIKKVVRPILVKQLQIAFEIKHRHLF